MGFFDDPDDLATNARRIREHLDADAKQRERDARMHQNAIYAEQRAAEAAERREYRRQLAAEARARREQLAAEERARQERLAAEERAAVQAWNSGPDGHAYRDWKIDAEAVGRAFDGRDAAIAQAFKADVDEAVSQTERSQFAEKVYSKPPRREVVANVLATIGLSILCADALFVVVWWVVSWGPAKFSTMLPAIIAAAAVGLALMIVCWTTQDYAWQRTNEQAHAAGIERRTSLFGFDPIGEPGRMPAWHVGERPNFAHWLDLDGRASHTLPMKHDLPELASWDCEIVALHDGHGMSRVSKLLDGWRGTSLVA